MHSGVSDPEIMGFYLPIKYRWIIIGRSELRGKKHKFTRHNTCNRLGLLLSPNLGHPQLKSMGRGGGDRNLQGSETAWPEPWRKRTSVSTSNETRRKLGSYTVIAVGLGTYVSKYSPFTSDIWQSEALWLLHVPHSRFLPSAHRVY